MTKDEGAPTGEARPRQDGTLPRDIAASFRDATHEEEAFAAALGGKNILGHLIQVGCLLLSWIFGRPRYRSVVARHRLFYVLRHLVFRSGAAYVAIAGVVAGLAGTYYAREQTRISAEQSRLARIQTRAAEAQARAADAEYARTEEAAYSGEKARMRGLLFDRASDCPAGVRYCRYENCRPQDRVCPLRSPIRIRTEAARDFVRLERQWRMRARADDLLPIDLQDVELPGAELEEVDFSGVDLRNADFRRASLARADLTAAWLQGADLRGTGLKEADFSCATLVFADLREAFTVGTDFAGADISAARGGEAFFVELGPTYGTYDESTDLAGHDPVEFNMYPGGLGNLDDAFAVFREAGVVDYHAQCAEALAQARDR